MTSESGRSKSRAYKVVLTGGPCGGKTTAQERLAVFFEGLGWKVFRPPETATLLLRGGVSFGELSPDQVDGFQNDLLLTVMQIESVYVNLAHSYKSQNCLLVFDRGTMDGSAYVSPEMWSGILQRNRFNTVDLRDNRYDQIVHMVTAADGAHEHYTWENNSTRSEGIAQAISVDLKTRQAWVGHPYVDIIDNKACGSFEDKILRLIQKFPKYEEFSVVHRYLRTTEKDVQMRLRARGQNGIWSYTHTVRRKNAKGEKVETRMQIGLRQYQMLCRHTDPRRSRTFKKRRCFLYDQQYFQLDIYSKPLPSGFEKLIILETYTTNTGSDFRTPDFLPVVREITGDPEFSLFALSLKRKNSTDSSDKTVGSDDEDEDDEKNLA